MIQADSLRVHDRGVSLRPKTAALLQYLVQRTGEVVLKTDLIRAVWSDAVVAEATLFSSIRELRHALGDDARSPRFIETVHGRGFRYVGEPPTPTLPPARTPAPGSRLVPGLYGREIHLDILFAQLEKARSGERATVFVSGEAGLGKTTLIEAFRSCVRAADPDVILARGACFASESGGLGFQPIIDALEDLGRTVHGERVLQLVRNHLPEWLPQMPTLSALADEATLAEKPSQSTLRGALRGICLTLERLSKDAPLIVILEDVHLSDHSTVDLLGMLAQRREPARLLILCTCRPSELMLRNHPMRAVKQSLEVRRQALDLALDPLGPTALTAWLEDRFPGGSVARGLTRVVHERSDGNPLFVTSLIDHAMAQGWISQQPEGWCLRVEPAHARAAVPATVREAIHIQVDSLPAETQRILEAASVEGKEFTAHPVAAALQGSAELVECVSLQLARARSFVRMTETADSAGGPTDMRFEFVHQLYSDVLYERLTPALRTRLHQRIGLHLEATLGARAEERAAELARHFEHAGDVRRAINYHRAAAHRATFRMAQREAVEHLRRALSLLDRLSDGVEGMREAAALHLLLGTNLVAMNGHTTDEVGEVYRSARDQAVQAGDPLLSLRALGGLASHHLTRAEFREARLSAGEIRDVMAALGLPDTLTAVARIPLLQCDLYAGRLAAVLEGCERVTPALTQVGVPDLASMQHEFSVLWVDYRVILLDLEAIALSLSGSLHEGLARSHEASVRVAELKRGNSGRPLAATQTYHLLNLALLHELRREPERVVEAAEEAVLMAQDHGIWYVRALALASLGAAQHSLGRTEVGLASIEEGLRVYADTRASLTRSHSLGLYAAILSQQDRRYEALAALYSAMEHIESTGERVFEAEVWRIKGSILARSRMERHRADAEESFRTAVRVAAEQGSLVYLLYASLDLAQMLVDDERRAEAVVVLSTAVDGFAGQPEFPALGEARALARSLA